MKSLAELPDVLRVEEAAAVLRISRGTAYELARRGELPVIRLGRRLLVSKAALTRMLEGERDETPDPPAPSSRARLHRF